VSRPPLIKFATTGGSAPGAYYLQEDDVLLVACSSNIGTAFPLIIRGRYLRPDGVIIPIEQSIVFNLTRAVLRVSIPLGEGYLLSLVATAANAVWNWGSVYVSLSIMRGTQAQPQIFQGLAAGYVTPITPVSWPASGIKGPLDSPGQLRSITGTTPGAGAEISETVPVLAQWRLIAFKFQFASAAAVANRFPQVTLDDGANIYSVTGTSTPQVALLTLAYTAAAGLGYNQPVETPAMIPLPHNLLMFAGHRIRTSTPGLQAADQYSAVQYFVEEWQLGV
jgi:hypothetical protein